MLRFDEITGLFPGVERSPLTKDATHGEMRCHGKKNIQTLSWQHLASIAQQFRGMSPSLWTATGAGLNSMAGRESKGIDVASLLSAASWKKRHGWEWNS